jgi:hypothetical protein
LNAHCQITEWAVDVLAAALHGRVVGGVHGVDDKAGAVVRPV